MCSSEQIIDPSLGLAYLGEQPRWYAVHTRPKHEKRAASELERKGIVTYLPLVTEIHHWSDRRKKIELPLFTGYLFVNIVASAEMRVSVLSTGGTLHFVGAHNQGDPIPEGQIEQIRTLLASKVPCSSHPFLKVGQRVRIRGGCLEGLEGILSAQNGVNRLVVTVDGIQRALSICLEGYDVEPV
jgi:transcription antitermination factor NusG